jgi:hypothetical protein
MKRWGAVCVLLMFAGAAAGASLKDDATAIFKGQDDAYAGSGWYAEVQYAVYAPGTFGGVHPDKATRYIYAYQVYCERESSYWLSMFGVPLDPLTQPANPTYDPNWGDPGGSNPLVSLLIGAPPTSVAWALAVGPGTHSAVLLFSSPYSYELGPCSIRDGGDYAEGLVPRPTCSAVVPEPLTICGVLLAIGAGGCLLRRRK